MIRRLEQLGMTEAALSREVKTTTANMTQLLKGPTKSSVLVPAIHKALGWPPPPPYWADDAAALKAELDALWQHLTDEELALIRSFVDLSKKRRD